MKKYFASRTFGPSVTELEVERETESAVWVNGSRLAKQSKYNGNVFDTFDDAKSHLVKRASARVESTKLTLEQAENDLARAEAITPANPTGKAS